MQISFLMGTGGVSNTEAAGWFHVQRCTLEWCAFFTLTRLKIYTYILFYAASVFVESGIGLTVQRRLRQIYCAFFKQRRQLADMEVTFCCRCIDGSFSSILVWDGVCKACSGAGMRFWESPGEEGKKTVCWYAFYLTLVVVHFPLGYRAFP